MKGLTINHMNLDIGCLEDGCSSGGRVVVRLHVVALPMFKSVSKMTKKMFYESRPTIIS